MAKINENTLAKMVSEEEGGGENLSIAQIKEVINVTLDLLSEYKMSEVVALIEKHAEEL